MGPATLRARLFRLLLLGQRVETKLTEQFQFWHDIALDIHVKEAWENVRVFDDQVKVRSMLFWRNAGSTPSLP